MGSAEQVRELRDQTGAGVLDCRKALETAGGDLAKAKDILRKQGHEQAAKRAERVARQGLISMQLEADGSSGVLVELLCETDFVARTESFRNFLKDCVRITAKNKLAAVEALLLYKDGGQTIHDRLTALIAQIGENIVLAAAGRLAASRADEKVGGYIHMGDQVGSLVVVKATSGKKGDISDAVLKDILLHITAMQPQYVSRDAVPQEKLAKLKEGFTKEAAATGKPPAILEKIVQGKLDKWLAEVCLVDQPFVRDPSGKTSVATFLKESGKGGLEILKFLRLQVGGQG